MTGGNGVPAGCLISWLSVLLWDVHYAHAFHIMITDGVQGWA